MAGPVLRYALLELLSDRPLTGYDLTKRFGASLIFFWHAGHTQIYRELKRMEGEGWVVSRCEIQDGRPNRKVYSVTEKGKEALVGWLLTESLLQQPKDEMLLKVFGFGLLPPEEAIGSLERHLGLHEKRLETFRGVEAGLRDRWGPLQGTPSEKDPLFCRRLTLYQAIAGEEMYIRWCRWAVEQIRIREAARPDAAGEEVKTTDAFAVSASAGL
ncbi:MAG: PadR family transcriptional regulator [Nitrospinota bacterium]|jgi:DNA-binding PadR family transcriptional regulator|nr:PadR family transcriptional regulator [Nitrospinota bacterium]MDP6618349.1 PadR family transcriptional regulator [Nitrospinota bacterium]